MTTRGVTLAPLHHLLRRELRNVVFPDETAVGDRVRVVIACWNYRKQGVERDAGIAWVRRQWQRQGRAEPTVVLGFEPRETVLGGAEASLFDNGAIEYVPLPASLAEIQAAIDRVLGTEAGELDRESSRRNAGEYWKRLFAWHHNFKGAVMANILATGGKLLPGSPDKVRRLEYQVLSGYRRDLVKERLEGAGEREGLLAICGDVVSGERGLDGCLQKAADALVEAARIWEGAWNMLQHEYSAERADRVSSSIGELRSRFEVIDQNLLRAMEITKVLAGEETADGR